MKQARGHNGLWCVSPAYPLDDAFLNTFAAVGDFLNACGYREGLWTRENLVKIDGHCGGLVPQPHAHSAQISNAAFNWNSCRKNGSLMAARRLDEDRRDGGAAFRTVS